MEQPRVSGFGVGALRGEVAGIWGVFAGGDVWPQGELVEGEGGGEGVGEGEEDGGAEVCGGWGGWWGGGGVLWG